MKKSPWGGVKITDRTDVTQPGWALDARQNNVAVVGGLRNLVEKISSGLEWKTVVINQAFPEAGSDSSVSVPGIAGAKEIIAHVGVNGASELYRTLHIYPRAAIAGAYICRNQQIASVYVRVDFASETLKFGTYMRENLGVHLASISYR